MSGTDFYYEPQVRLAEELSAISPIAGGSRSFFGNSGTEAVEACLKLARYSTGRQNLIAFLGGLPRAEHGIARADGQQGDPAPRLRTAHARRVSRAVRGLLPLSARTQVRELRGRVPRLHRASDLRPPRLARRGRRHRRRADPGRGRLCRRARSVPAAPARAHEHARHPARGRRGAVGDGAVGEDVRDRVRGRRAGHGGDRQRHRVGTAARRGRGAQRADGVAAWRARQHVRRQPGVVRGGDRDDSAAEARAHEERRGRRRASESRRSRRSWTSIRSSAMFAAAA